jgi:hypothetical protein
MISGSCIKTFLINNNIFLYLPQIGSHVFLNTGRIEYEAPITTVTSLLSVREVFEFVRNPLDKIEGPASLAYELPIIRLEILK